ncbi:MAG: tyrosine-type recombinase/integrase, partial [Bacteroidales bacterium]
MMKISKINHKGLDRVMLEFPYNRDKGALVKQITGAAWSRTHSAWLIPDTKEAFEQLISYFPDAGYTPPHIQPTVDKTKTDLPEIVKSRKPFSTGVEIWVIGKQIQIKLPKNETDIQFLRSFQYVRWNKSEFHWVVPNYGKNLELLQNYFNTRVTTLEFRKEPEQKPVPIFTKPESITTLALLTAENRLDMERFGQWMEHKRYSASTVETYAQAIAVFLRFISPKTSAEAINEDMQRFVNHYMIPRGLSFSYQNQAINAAKLFFRLIHGSAIITEQLERPRREHKLPNVLSKEEVKAILGASQNQKHRAMLSLIYACGLRRGELLNLKPANIDSKRHLLLILNAKGKKDRVVPISDKVIEMLRAYFTIYRPKV